MNQIEKEFFGLLDMTHQVRDSGLALISEDDLAFGFAGCPKVGDLLTEFGDVEYAYARSFVRFAMEFGPNSPGREAVNSGKTAIDWLHGLDDELKSALSGLSDDDLGEREIDRGGWKIPVAGNFHTYREAVLILCAKLDLYLKSLGKAVPEAWAHWLG